MSRKNTKVNTEKKKYQVIVQMKNPMRFLKIQTYSKIQNETAQFMGARVNL